MEEQVAQATLVIAAIAAVLLWLSAVAYPRVLPAVLVVAVPLFALTLKAFRVSPPFPSVETAAVTGLAVCYGFRRALSGKRVARGPVGSGIALGLFIACALFSTIVSSRAGLSLKIVVAGIWPPAVAYFVGRATGAEREARRVFAIGLCVLAVIVGIYTASNLVIRVGVTGALSPSTLMWMRGDGAINNLFVSPSGGVMTILVGIPVGMWLLFNETRLIRVLGALSVGSVFFVSLFSFSRGGWMVAALLIVVAPMICFESWKHRLITLVSVVLIIAAVFAASGVATEVVSAKMGAGDSRFDQVQQQNRENVLLRLQNYGRSVVAIFRYPLVGVGLGNYQESYSDGAIGDSGGGAELWFAHNLVLTLIIEIGALGAFSYVVFCAVGVRAGLTARFPDRRERKLNLCMVAGALGILLLASTTGGHLISHLQPVESDTYFCAPTMIVLFTTLGVLSSQPATGSRRRQTAIMEVRR